MLDQVKPEVVLPLFQACISDLRGNAYHSTRLPNDEIGLLRQSSASEKGIPIHSGRLRCKVAAFPRIVLFEYIRSILVRREGTGHARFQRQDANGFRVWVGD